MKRTQPKVVRPLELEEGKSQVMECPSAQGKLGMMLS